MRHDRRQPTFKSWDEVVRLAENTKRSFGPHKAICNEISRPMAHIREELGPCKTLLIFTQREFGLLPLGHILHRSDDPPSSTGLGPRDVGAAVDVRPHAIDTPKTVFARPDGFGATDCRANTTNRPVPVL